MIVGIPELRLILTGTCRYATIRANQEVNDGSILYEVPRQEGNEGCEADHHEKR